MRLLDCIIPHSRTGSSTKNTGSYNAIMLFGARLAFILFVQGGCQAQAECPVPEGAGMFLKLGIACLIKKVLYWIGILLCLWLSVHIYSEPAGEASEGFEEGGVCCRHGQCH